MNTLVGTGLQTPPGFRTREKPYRLGPERVRAPLQEEAFHLFHIHSAAVLAKVIPRRSNQN